MGQYYRIANPTKKERIEFSLCKAAEIFLNEDDLGRMLIILYHDQTCIGKGGGDLPIQSDNEFVGRWLNTSFVFVGDYSETSLYSESENYLDITKDLWFLVNKLFNFYQEH